MRKVIFVSLIILLLLSACGGKSDPGIGGVKENCVITNNHGSCNGYFKVVRNENTHYFKKIVLQPDETIFLELNVSVAKGDLIVSVINFDGYPVDYLVTPDAPAAFELWVIGDSEGLLPIQFNADKGSNVEDVGFSLKFTRSGE